MKRRGRRRASSHDLETIVEPGGDVYVGLLERGPSRRALLLSSPTASSGDLSDRLTELRFATVDRVAALAELLAPAAEDETLHAIAHAISGVSEQLGRWWTQNPEIPRTRILSYHRTFHRAPAVLESRLTRRLDHRLRAQPDG